MQRGDRKLAERLNVTRCCFKYWRIEKRSLPKEIFQEIIKIYPELTDYKKHIKKEVNENWGRSKGGKKRIKILKETGRFKERKFYEYGGFIDGIKISGKSRYFEGIEKNKVLEKCLNIDKFKSLVNLRKEIIAENR